MTSYYFHCCLLFLLPAFCQAQCGVSRRRPWRSLSCGEQDQFLNALRALKASGVYDDIARVHWLTGGAAHNVPAFLPWHRYYLWVFEQQLQRASGTCVTVPFWDWERPDSLETVFRGGTFGSQNGGGCVDSGVSQGWNSQVEGCLRREFNRRWTFSRDVEVLSRITNSNNFASFSVELEGAPHASVHQFIGGQMRNTFSSEDPLFWLHHANVDRIWALWQNYQGHHNLGPEDYEWEHYHANLDSQLTINGDRGGYFDRPSIRQVLSNRGLVNVQYMDDNLARNLIQTSGQFAQSINEGWNVPVRANEQCNGNNNIGGGGNNNNNGGNQGGQGNQQGQGQDQQQGQNQGQGQQEQEQQPLCLATDDPCLRNNQCCSGQCWRGECWDDGGNEELPNCLAPDEPCVQNRQCCSSQCWRGECLDDGSNQQPQQQPPQQSEEQTTCREIEQACNSHDQCCSGRCRQGECWSNEINNGGNQPSCRELLQGCNQNSQCCSGQCVQGSCWDLSVGNTPQDNEDQQARTCGLAGNQCRRNRHCCSRWCQSDGTCRGDGGDNNSQQQEAQQGGTCREGDEPCTRNSHCCSRACRARTMTCRSQRLRRVTANNEYWQIPSQAPETNEYWQTKDPVSGLDEPELSSMELDSRWHELMNLYNGTRPDLIFEILGREDCENRSVAANHTIESASSEWIQSLHLPNETMHTYDCHYLIVHGTEN
ncbi:Hemocyanin, beta-C chain unit [Seminavis robusta]|uniref:Hemocyanin, beta-C chain unit n=1 Tax=Seminavis robusta TaxID=568900 RepID=A0A9N8DN83_9STRA|nr:Hemocyanin, beta-C chain unit [Seminavis robusta]|eukprot:Sro239_g095740.1 Hemocyanin, beta-C chain unit (709) ;mRNA; f:6098-8494